MVSEHASQHSDNESEHDSVKISSNPPMKTETSVHNDPFFIHPSDNPTTVLFSPLLQSDNYPTWVRGISKALNAKNKLGFVDGTIQIPTDPFRKTCWKRCDDLVCSWLLNSMHSDIRTSCMYADSSFTIWQDLNARFTGSNGPKLYNSQVAIYECKQDGLSVTAYYTKLKSLWDQYDSLDTIEPCMCGAGKRLIERHERDRAMKFLQGLHDRFFSLKSQILLIEPLPTAPRIFNLVKQEEEQQFINASIQPTIDSAALNFNKFDNSYGNKNGQHNKYDARFAGGNNNKRPRPFCDHCNRHGHTRQTCWRIHGRPEQPKVNTNTSNGRTYYAGPTNSNNNDETWPLNDMKVQSYSGGFNFGNGSGSSGNTYNPAPLAANQFGSIPTPAPHVASSYGSGVSTAIPTSSATPFSGLSADQYARLIALLSTDETNIEPRINNLSGPSNEHSDW